MFFPAVIALSLALVIWPLTRSKRVALNAMTRIVGYLGCVSAGIRLDVSHRERMLERPAIFIFNHQSGVDPVILARILNRDVVAIANAKLKPHPIIGPLLKFGDTLFVDKNTAGAYAEEFSSNCVARAIAKSKSGLSIVIAPEGTRTRGKVLGEFRSGAFVMAAKLGVPIVPIVIHSAHQVLPPDSMEMRPGRVNVTVLPPRKVKDSVEAIEAERTKAHEEMYHHLIGEVSHGEESKSSFS